MLPVVHVWKNWFSSIVIVGSRSRRRLHCFSTGNTGRCPSGPSKNSSNGIAKSRIWETAALLVVAFTLFRPGYWLDQIEAPWEVHPGPAALEALAAPPGTDVRLVLQGPDFDTFKLSQTTIVVPSVAGDGQTALSEQGLSPIVEGDVLRLDEPFPGTPFFRKLTGAYDFYGDEPVQILRAEVAADRPPKELFFIPAFLLLALIVLVQRRRATQAPF